MARVNVDPRLPEADVSCNKRRRAAAAAGPRPANREERHPLHSLGMPLPPPSALAGVQALAAEAVADPEGGEGPAIVDVEPPSEAAGGAVALRPDAAQAAGRDLSTCHSHPRHPKGAQSGQAAASFLDCRRGHQCGAPADR